VLLITSDFPPVPGGQARFLYDLWTCLPPDQVLVLAPAMEGAEQVDRQLDCRVVRVRLPLGQGRMDKLLKPWYLLWVAWGLCRRLPIASVHCGQVFSAGFAGLGCRLLAGVSYYPYVHGADLLEFRGRFLLGWLLRCILRHARRVIANSGFTGRAVQACGVEPDRIEVLHPALDLQRFAALPVAVEAMACRGWQGRRVILCVGRLVERKGQDMLIRALPKIAAVVPQVLVALVGTGPYRAELERLAQDLGMADRVAFLGFVPEAELPACYAAAEVFAMPSREIPQAGDVEGFGIVFLEANAAGLPVLGGCSGGVGEAVQDGYSGLLVDPEDPEAVAGGLLRLLGDEGLRRRLGSQGRERVRRDFDRRQRAARLWQACR
jgi:phosphatidylinositol alpha-1,6-mannosyltransferase